jgi:hypothetical protein
MRESFAYGSVGRAPGNRCLYPETRREKQCGFTERPCKLEIHVARWLSVVVMLGRSLILKKLMSSDK